MLNKFKDSNKLDKRSMLRELDTLKKTVGTNEYKKRVNTKEAEAGGQRLLKQAQADIETKKENSNKDIVNWAKAESDFIAGRARNRVSSIGGIGMGKPNICDDCGKRVSHTRSEWIDKRWLKRCDPCRTNNAPERIGLKIIIK